MHLPAYAALPGLPAVDQILQEIWQVCMVAGNLPCGSAARQGQLHLLGAAESRFCVFRRRRRFLFARIGIPGTPLSGLPSAYPLKLGRVWLQPLHSDLGDATKQRVDSDGATVEILPLGAAEIPGGEYRHSGVRERLS